MLRMFDDREYANLLDLVIAAQDIRSSAMNLMDGTGRCSIPYDCLGRLLTALDGMTDVLYGSGKRDGRMATNNR